MISAADLTFAGPVPTGAIRKQEPAVIQLPENPDPVNGVSLYFKSKERKLCSTNQYFGL